MAMKRIRGTLCLVWHVVLLSGAHSLLALFEFNTDPSLFASTQMAQQSRPICKTALTRSPPSASPIADAARTTQSDKFTYRADLQRVLHPRAAEACAICRT